jgi:phosphonate transport system substrate-binding protein
MTTRSLVLAVLTLVLLAACSNQPGESASAGTEGEPPTLVLSAIPDQDPAGLAAREESMAGYLSGELDVPVEYVPVTDYAASVSLFRAGDLDLVFYGGLTGVQARLQTPGARLLAQRDVDERFRSVFIANATSGIDPVTEVDGLTVFEGTRFTFGSESSTSGRLMPEYFLMQAGVDSGSGFVGEPGYSGSHDKTIDLVEAGSYDAGALNAQVWAARKEAGTVDLDKVVEVYTTAPYHDYHWIAGPDLDTRFGDGFTDDLQQALLGLDGTSEAERQLLEAYGAESVVPTEPGSYDEVEEIGRELGLVGP